MLSPLDTSLLGGFAYRSGGPVLTLRARRSQHSTLQRKGYRRCRRIANSAQRFNQTFNPCPAFRRKQAPHMGFTLAQPTRELNLRTPAELTRPARQDNTVGRNVTHRHSAFVRTAPARFGDFFAAAQALTKHYVQRIGSILQRLLPVSSIRRQLGKVPANDKNATVFIRLQLHRIRKNCVVGHGSLLEFIFGDIEIAQHLVIKTGANFSALYRRRPSANSYKLVAALASLWRHLERQAMRSGISARAADEFFSVHSRMLPHYRRTKNNTIVCAQFCAQ